MTTTEAPEQTADNTPETVADPFEGLDQLSQSMVQLLEKRMNEYASLDSKLKAAEGDREDAIEDFIENSDHPAAVKLRDQRDKLIERFRKLAEAELSTESLSEEDKEKIRVELGSMKVKIKAGREAAENWAISGNCEDPDKLKELIGGLKDPTRSGRGRKPGSAGSSLPRVSVLLSITGGNIGTRDFDSMSKAAQVLDWDLKELQLAFAAAANVPHEEIKTVDKPLTFEFKPEGSETVYSVHTTPKERAKTGPKPKTDESAAQSE